MLKETTDSEGFVLVSDVIPDAMLDIRYYSTYNFLGERVDGYEEPVAILTREAADALKKVSDDAVKMGYRLKIFDCYRPQAAVDHFVRWAEEHREIAMKGYFYPEVDKARLFDEGFVAKKSGHSRGSTVDLTLFEMDTQKDLDMGGTFDYFGYLSWADFTEEITEKQVENRKLLRNLMLSHGFKPLAEEWWHFTLENEPYPDTYFTFPVNSAQVRKASTFTERLENDMEFRLRFFDAVAESADSNRKYLEEAARKVIFSTAEKMEKFSLKENIGFDEKRLNEAVSRMVRETTEIIISLLK